MVLDPKIPFLENTLDPAQAQVQLQAAMPTVREVTAARLVRHKPGRRALVEYRAETASGPLTLLGKIRAKGTDRPSYQIQQALWHHGWAADSADGCSIPEPLGLVPDWHMALQRQVPGTPATQRLATAQGIPLAKRIAELAHKLHRTPIPTLKTHTLADELSILRDRLPLVASQHPQWSTRIDHVLNACEMLAAQFPDPGAEAAGLNVNVHSVDTPQTHPTTPPPHHPTLPVTLIHRDFYADQILVDDDNPGGPRLWLVDLDLCCQGSPALDIGNFIAHIAEQSLRENGDAAGWSDGPSGPVFDHREAALQAAYIDAYCGAAPGGQAAAVLAREVLAREIDCYAALTLVRHIHISTQIASRRPFTEAILALGEARLDALLN